MADLIDVLTAAGLRTGEVLPRAEIHRLGKVHRAVHLYLLNPRGEILLQRRTHTVDHAPGALGISVTGHVAAGEGSGAALRREVREELGLDASRLEIDFLFSHFQEAILDRTYIDRQFNDVYVARADVDSGTICIDPIEVAEFRFMPFGEFVAMATDTSSPFGTVYAAEVRDLTHLLDGSLAL